MNARSQANREPFVPKPYALEKTDQGLVLREHGWRGQLHVDFNSISWKRRLQQFGQSSLLARAIGLKPQYRPEIVDLTAGLGRDAFLLASMGCLITALERSPIIYALLADGLSRCQQSPLADIAARITLIQTQSLQWLATQTTSVPVIYYDPMLLSKKGSALVKKEWQILQALIGNDNDQVDVAKKALTHITSRLVIKRPLQAPPLLPNSHHCLKGKRVRFDVYTQTTSIA